MIWLIFHQTSYFRKSDRKNPCSNSELSETEKSRKLVEIRSN